MATIMPAELDAKIMAALKLGYTMSIRLVRETRPIVLVYMGQDEIGRRGGDTVGEAFVQALRMIDEHLMSGGAEGKG